ncbi:MAG TPA: efflux transporter outer membrane subunit, partial [Rhodocyclaceae bacterium]|nr:efflux transporter outer membrane subunit [Rhodocyclaceae bacterium]
MKTCLRPLPVILVVLLSACRIGPDYVRPEMAVPTVYKEAGDWKPAAPADPAAGDAWWTAFGDPVLDQLQARLLVSNQNLRAVEAQYRQARALADSARASGFPTVTGSVGMTRGTSGSSGSSGSSTASQGPAAVTNSYSLGASSSWEADVWGRIARNVEAADARVEASDADLAAARLSARATLAQTYFQLRSAERQKRLLEATVAAYERALELTRNRYAAGVAGRADVVQAESLLRSTRAQTIDVRLSRAQYEHAIAVLIGEAPAAFTLAESDAPLPVAVTPVSLPSTLLERRPDIAAAERRVAAANAAVGAAQAARFPVLGLTAGAGYRSSDLSELLSLSSRYWSLGPTVAASLFDGGAKRAATGQAVAVWDQAVATYRQTVLTAFQEVEDNLVAARLLEHELTEQNAAVTAAAEAEAIALNQYRAGTVSYLNVVTAQTTLLTARRSANDLAA